MASETAWSQGWQLGGQIASEQRQHKQMLADKELEMKTDQLGTQHAELTKKLAELKDDGTGKPRAGYDKVFSDLQKNAADIRETLHPDNNPGAIAKFGHLITDKLGITKPAPTPTMVIAHPKGIREQGNLPIWDRPSVVNADGSHSSEFSTSFKDPKTGYEVLVPTIVKGRFLTPDGKKPPAGRMIPDPNNPGKKIYDPSEEEKTMFKAAWDQYLQTGEHLGKFENAAAADAYAHALHTRGDKIPKNIQKQEANTAQDKASATRDAAAAPFSPEQQAKQDVDVDSQKKLATISTAVQNWNQLNPTATSEQKSQFLTDQIEKIYGMTAKGNWKNVPGKLNGVPTTLQFDSSLGRYRYQNGESVPAEVLQGNAWVPDVNQTADVKKRQDFEAFKEDYKKKHNGEEYSGTFESWVPEQSAAGRAKSKPSNLDEQYKQALVDQQLGKTLTEDQKARMAAWHIYNRETKIDPGVARMNALAAGRYIPVINPANNEEVVMMRAGDAAKAGAKTPASIAFQIDKAITRAFTSGKSADNINYFNTATEHLKIMAEAADALNNGNVQLFNRFGNDWATATGDPRPVDFDAARNAVAGELSKTFRNAAATDQEIEAVVSTVNSAQSPDQLAGVINYYLRLMGGKMDALRGQYEAGKEGRPNFPGGATQSGGGKSKGSRSLAAAMSLPVNKGKSAAEVEKHLLDLGYTVTKP